MSKEKTAQRPAASPAPVNREVAAAELQARANAIPGVADVIRVYASYHIALEAARAAAPRRMLISSATASATAF